MFHNMKKCFDFCTNYLYFVIMLLNKFNKIDFYFITSFSINLEIKYLFEIDVQLIHSFFNKFNFFEE